MANTYRFSISNLLKRFQKDQQGGVLVLYAGLALPIFAIVGGAIDYSRVVSARSEILRASEAAASAAANLSASSDDLQSIFDAHFNANLSARLRKTPYQFEYDQETRKITATVDHPVKMHFAAILGIKQVTVSVKAIEHFAIVAKTENRPPAARKEAIDDFDLEAEKRRIMRDIRARVKRARLQGIKFPEISNEKLEKFAEQLARRSKR